MSGEIHHGHHEHAHGGPHQAWKADGLPGGVPTGAPGEAAGAHKSHAEAKHKQQAANLQRDVQETAQNTDNNVKNNTFNIASGFRYATLSQHQLDSADPKHPVPTDPKSRAVMTSPPPGVGGTGNPFFKANPMTTFFTVFTMLMQTLKQLQKAETRLTVISMQNVKDTGLSQAQATLDAGKAAAKSEFIQGILSAVQGGFMLGQLGHSVATDMKFGSQAGKAMKEEQTEATDIENQANTQEKDVADAQARANAKTKYLKGEPEVSISDENPAVKRKQDAAGKEQAKKKLAKEARKNEENNYEAAQQNFQAKAAKGNKEEIQQAREDLHKAAEKRQKAVEADEYYEVKSSYAGAVPNEKQKAQLRKEIAADQSAILQGKSTAASLKQNAKDHWNKSEEYNMSGTNLKAWERRASLKQQDIGYQRTVMGVQAINYMIEAGKHWAKGVGDEQQAYFQSYGQIMATYNQMIKTGLDSAISARQDAYQQAGDLAQTLIKMSDQESQSMHWAA